MGDKQSKSPETQVGVAGHRGGRAEPEDEGQEPAVRRDPRPDI
jgi:hypothetical protein